MLDALTQRGDVESIAGKLAVVAHVVLGHIRQSDAQAGQQRKLGRREQPGRQRHRVQRAPEQVAGVRVVRTFLRRSTTRSGAAEHYGEAGLEQVGKDRGGHLPKDSGVLHARPMEHSPVHQIP
jgi:hypothetical protein